MWQRLHHRDLSFAVVFILNTPTLLAFPIKKISILSLVKTTNNKEQIIIFLEIKEIKLFYFVLFYFVWEKMGYFSWRKEREFIWRLTEIVKGQICQRLSAEICEQCSLMSSGGYFRYWMQRPAELWKGTISLTKLWKGTSDFSIPISIAHIHCFW